MDLVFSGCMLDVILLFGIGPAAVELTWLDGGTETLGQGIWLISERGYALTLKNTSFADLSGTPGPHKPADWPGVEALPYWNPHFPAMRPKDLRTEEVTRGLCISAHADASWRNRSLMFSSLMSRFGNWRR